MVATCCVIGCTNRSDHNKDISFYSIPAVLKHQGARTEELSAEHHRVWIAKINRNDWTPTRNSFVCPVHLINSEINNYKFVGTGYKLATVINYL